MTGADLRAITWRCVHFASREDAAEAWQDSHPSLFVGRFSAATISEKKALLAQLQSTFRMPSYLGMNWDAIEEGLRDLEWIAAKAYIVFVEDADHLWKVCPSIAGTLVEVWLSAAEQWARSEISFH